MDPLSEAGEQQKHGTPTMVKISYCLPFLSLLIALATLIKVYVRLMVG